MNWMLRMERTFPCALAMGLACLAAPVWAGKLGPVVPAYDTAKGGTNSISANHGMTPSDVVVLDFNHDDIDDLIVSYAFSDEIGLFAGDGAGGFALVKTLGLDAFQTQSFDDSPRKLLVADFDLDGFEDLVTINSGYGPFSSAPAVFWTQSTMGIFYGLPRGGFEEMRNIQNVEEGIEPGDRLFAFSGALGLNAEGHERSFWVGYAYSNEIQQFRSSRDNRDFEPGDVIQFTTPGFGPYDLQEFPRNGAAVTGLLVVNERDVQIHRASPTVDDHRVVIHEGTEMLSGVVSDFDQDGKWDVAVADGGADELVIVWGLNILAEYERKTSIALPPNSGAVAVELVDANLDGFMDLAVLYRNGNRGQVFLNAHGNRDGMNSSGMGFTPGMIFETSRFPRAIATLDIDGDSKPDFVVANEGDQSNDDGMDLNNQDVTVASNDSEIARGFSLIGVNSTDFTSLPGLGPQLGVVSGLAWDATRQALWTIDRERGLLVALNENGEIRDTFALSGIAPGYHDFIDVVADGEGLIWLLDRPGNRVIGWSPGGDDQRIIHPGDFQIHRPEFLSIRGDRLAIVDEYGRIVQVTTLGEFVEAADVSVARDMSFDPVHERYVALIGQNSLLSDDFHHRFHTQTGSFYRVNDLAAFLDGVPQTGRWIAFGDFEADASNADGYHGRVDMWLLTTQGTLAKFQLRRREVAGQLNWEFELLDAFELRLLRDIAAIERTEDGGLLLGDAGPLGTIVRLDGEGNIVDRYRLDPGTNSGDLRISDLALLPDYLVVANAGRAQDGLLVFEGEHGEGEYNGSIRLTNGPGSKRSVHIDPVNLVLYTGDSGKINRRLLIYDEENDEEPYSLSPIGPGPANIILPAYMEPSAISAGPRPGTIAVWVPDYQTVLIIDPDSPEDPTNVLRRRAFPLGFQARTGLFPTAEGQPGWLAGTGESNLIEFTLEEPPSSAQMWQSYP